MAANTRRKAWIGVALLASLTCGCNKVPDLTGMTQQQAQDALTKAKLTLGTVTNANLPNKQPGTVIDQDPAPKAKIPDNKTVSIVLQQGGGTSGTGGNAGNTGTGGSGSLNQNPGLIAVPDLTGKTQDDAAVTLAGNGLVLGNVNVVVASQAAGKIFQQDPPANTQVQPGTSVSVTLASDAMVQVPSVIGRSQGDAENTIRAAQLVPVSQPVIDTGGEAVGTVFDQNPSASLTVAKGQNVTLRVKQDSVQVPNVVGEDQSQAQLQLFQSGLTPNLSFVPGDATNFGKVLSQSIPPTTSVPRNQQVTLVVGGLRRHIPLFTYNRAVTTIQH